MQFRVLSLVFQFAIKSRVLLKTIQVERERKNQLEFVEFEEEEEFTIYLKARNEQTLLIYVFGFEKKQQQKLNESVSKNNARQ